MAKLQITSKMPTNPFLFHLAKHCFIILYILFSFLVYKKPLGAVLNIDQARVCGCVPVLLETALTDRHVSSCKSALLRKHTHTYCTSQAESFVTLKCVYVGRTEQKEKFIRACNPFLLRFSTHPLIPLPLYIFSHLISWTGNKFHVLRSSH